MRRKEALRDCPWDELAGREREPVLGLDEIIGYVADEFSCQQARANGIAEQGEGALACESCSLRDLVGHGVVEHRLRWHCDGYCQHGSLAFISSSGHELCRESRERGKLLLGAQFMVLNPSGVEHRSKGVLVARRLSELGDDLDGNDGAA